MCCFSGNVDVSNTRIFARFLGKQTQALVYQMKYQTKDQVAMVLPIPTPSGTKEDALKFISLEKYKRFFVDLNSGFPQPKPTGRPMTSYSLGTAKGALNVEEVGDFIASFVPSVADFSRLDERFRLPAKAWEQLPKQKTYGFAVFQLKAKVAEAQPAPDPRDILSGKTVPAGQGAATETHPMAFTFPTAANAELFFPTVHIHDGEVHAEADFDHVLYLQPREMEEAVPRQWEESTQPCGMFANEKEAQGLLDGSLHLYRRKLIGKLKNVDTFV